MTWLNDLTEARYDLMTVDKQQEMLHKSSSFTSFPVNEVLRVFQLDALSTQEEIINILQNCLFSIFEIKPLQAMRFRYQEELSLALESIIFYFSTWRNGQTIGDRMHNLVFRDEARAREYKMTNLTILHHTLAPHRRLLLLYALFNIVIPYALRKVYRRLLVEPEESETSTRAQTLKKFLRKILQYLTISWELLTIVNTLHFLVTGKYRSLIDRILSLKVVYGSQKMQRLTNLQFLNQQIMWQTWMSLLNVLRFGRYLTRFVQSLQQVIKPTESSLNFHDDVNVCTACHNQLTLSQRANCGHLYCYYCIKSRLIDCQASGSFRCYQCGQAVYSCSPA